MVADGRTVAGLAVQCPAQSGPGGGNRRARADRAEAQRGPGRPEAVGDTGTGQVETLFP